MRKYAEARAEFDRHYLEDAIMETGGRINEMSRLSGISKSQLYRMFEATGMKVEKAKTNQRPLGVCDRVLPLAHRAEYAIYAKFAEFASYSEFAEHATNAKCAEIVRKLIKI